MCYQYAPLSDAPATALHISPSAYAFRAYSAAYFQGFRAAVTQGAIRFDLLPQKRGSKCVERDMKKPGQEADTPALLPWLLLDCRTVLSHKRAADPLVAPAGTVHLLRVCTVPAGQITATITPAAIRSLCFPLPFHSLLAALPPVPQREGQGKGKGWVIDKSWLILSLVTYIYILLRWIFRRRFSRQRIIRRRKCQQRQKGKARLFVPCPLSSISCRGGCYRPDLKSSRQVVHLRGHLLKVQIYQPFSRTGCVLPW